MLEIKGETKYCSRSRAVFSSTTITRVAPDDMTAVVANPDGTGIASPAPETASPLWTSRDSSGIAGVAVSAVVSADSEGISLVLSNRRYYKMAQLYGQRCCRDTALGGAAGVWNEMQFEHKNRGLPLLHSPMCPHCRLAKNQSTSPSLWRVLVLQCSSRLVWFGVRSRPAALPLPRRHAILKHDGLLSTEWKRAGKVPWEGGSGASSA